MESHLRPKATVPAILKRKRTICSDSKPAIPAGVIALKKSSAQLMEDIDSILSEWVETNTDCFSEFQNNADAKDDLVRTLCDAVCKHFPTTVRVGNTIVNG